MKTNEFLALAAATFCGAAAVLGQTWTQTSAPDNFWNSIASSADGTKLLAVGNLSTFVYLSTNSGVSWSSNNIDSSVVWKCAASSADGNTLIAGSIAGGLYISTNAGAAWKLASVSNYWISVASSADGTRFVAASLGDGYGGLIYTSTNSGVTWYTNNVPTNLWAGVASSADGAKLAAVAGLPNGGYGFASGPIITSTNGGVTWAPTSAGSNLWSSVACSADGTRLIAGSISGTHFSTNSGFTWSTNNFPAYLAQSVASSADGSKLVIGLEGSIGGPIVYTSSDSGLTWTTNSLPGNFPSGPYYQCMVASSADGGKLEAGVLQNSGIFTSYSPPSAPLNLQSSHTNLILSWTVPSTNFVLQQNLDLSPANWRGVTNVPVLNLTNLQNQVALPAPAGSVFFRLKVP